MIEPGRPEPGNYEEGVRSSRLASGEPTGRQVVLFAAGVDERTAEEKLGSIAGVRDLAKTSDFASHAIDVRQAERADAIMFSEIGAATVVVEPDRAEELQSAVREKESRILSVEPELVFQLLDPASTATLDYDRGWQRGAVAASILGGLQDTDQATWGLQATGVTTSGQSGRDVRVAILDTGLDQNHPDFTGRNVVAQSFVPGATADDGHGHGTHCAGTACGSGSPRSGPRYGIAYESDILVGKVLSDQGFGTDTNILAGINWAIANNSQIVSMSLGADVRQVSDRYEIVGLRALAAGSLIIAAAGNNAHRSQNDFGFVGVPANSSSIIAVAAVDAQFEVADFSTRSTPASGGQIDLAGPGVDVYSSWVTPRKYNVISGTSMATPHVAGIAALWCEKTGQGALELWGNLTRASFRLRASSLDVGAGLTQAPQ